MKQTPAAFDPFDQNEDRDVLAEEIAWLYGDTAPNIKNRISFALAYYAYDPSAAAKNIEKEFYIPYEKLYNLIEFSHWFQSIEFLISQTNKNDTRKHNG